VLWAGATAVVAVAAFLIGGHVRSPWDAAIANADTDPVVTAKVAERAVATDTNPLTGTVKLGTTTALTVASSGGAGIVTKMDASPGDVVRPAQVIGEVSGTSVATLTLPFALYRDLAPGDTGTDVRAVQQELATLGLLDASAVDGTYDAATATAVHDLFRKGGGTPPTAATEKDTPLPRATVVLVPAKGAEVLSSAKVGTDLSGGGALLTIRSGVPSVTVRAAVDQVLKKGATVTVVSSDDAKVSTTGTVTSVSSFDAGGGGQVPGYDLTIRFPATKGLTDGDTVNVTPTSGSPAKTGLAVPLTALRDGAGGTYVLRVAGTSGAGDDEQIPVTVGTTGGGYALVTGTDLRTGDTVVVSQR
jgi:peptidoglycan hydrolase-like protein with peptidoglycan-binding domain